MFCLTREPRQFRIEVDQKWQPRWPRPTPAADGLSCIDIPLDVGRLDFQAIHRAAREVGGLSLATRWPGTLLQMYGDEGTVSLKDFLLDVPKVVVLSSLGRQVLWHVSLALEIACGAQVKRGKEHSSLKFKWHADAHMGSCRLDKSIAMYVKSTQVRLKGEVFFGVATDKAWVHALPLHAAIFTLPSGEAILATPAVGPIAGIHWLPHRRISRGKRLGKTSEPYQGLGGGCGEIFAVWHRKFPHTHRPAPGTCL